MFWSFELELTHGLRTKKLWIMTAAMLLIYVPTVYLLKTHMGLPTTGGIIGTITGSLSSGVLFFLGVVSIVMGSTLINDDIEKGTVTISLSKPITRHGYYLGRYAGQAVSVLIALLAASAIFLIALRAIGIPVTRDAVVQVLLLTLLLFLAMAQLLALGHLISAFIRSHLASIGAAIGVFFLIYLIIPGVITTVVVIKSIESSANAQTQNLTDNTTVINQPNYADLLQDYYTKYAFYSPTAQVNVILMNTNSHGEYAGIAHAVRKSWINFVLLIVMTAVYSGLTLWRFRRMDLR
ncbi:MAG: ABC transporter permease subunit [Thermococci archaeon]|nr:ABC transporter permease subunit [Thermococci archaeon]